MNNYIPINKAVNPVCIYQGYEPLISKTLGVDEMIYGFDGTPSDCLLYTSETTQTSS